VNRWTGLALLVAGALTIRTGDAQAQSALLKLPDLSQHARVAQRIGLTDITIDYHRPLVRGRKIFGGVQAYGEVWRAGANLNTTIEFSDPVTIEGKPLPKGTYGLHFIPGSSAWVAIFSNNSTSWGSFTYDEKEDALRVVLRPHAIELQEALRYEFDDPTDTSCAVTMQWEHTSVSFKVAVNTPKIVARSLRDQLRGRVQTEWQAWEEAANYLIENHLDANEAVGYADKSIAIEDRFENEITKARALTAVGRTDEARGAEHKALELGSERQVYDFARSLQRLGQQEQALAILRRNVEKHADGWLAHVERARLAVGGRDYAAAVKAMRAAANAAPPAIAPSLADLLRQLENGVDINK
jgi:tetratricopeptide (TPR) repeat protein